MVCEHLGTITRDFKRCAFRRTRSKGRSYDTGKKVYAVFFNRCMNAKLVPLGKSVSNFINIFMQQPDFEENRGGFVGGGAS